MRTPDEAGGKRREGPIGNEEAKGYRVRLHWVMIMGPATVMVISGLLIPDKGRGAALVLALATIWGVFASISFERSEIVLFPERLVVSIGFPWRRTYEVPLEDIEAFEVYQPSLGKFLDFGRITIRRKRGRRVRFRMVRSPQLLAQKVYEYKQGNGY